MTVCSAYVLAKIKLAMPRASSLLPWLLILLPPLAIRAAAAVDTTAVGFTEVALTEAQFPVQRPYDVPLHERFAFRGGVRRMWVYCTDKPHTPTSRTKPRTEIGIKVILSSNSIALPSS